MSTGPVERSSAAFTESSTPLTSNKGTDGSRSYSVSSKGGKPGEIYKFTPKAKLDTTRKGLEKLQQKTITRGGKGLKKIPFAGKKVQQFVQKQVRDPTFGSTEELSGEATSKVAEAIAPLNESIDGLLEGIEESRAEIREIENLLTKFSDEPLDRSSKDFDSQITRLSESIVRSLIESGERPMEEKEIEHFEDTNDLEALKNELDTRKHDGVKSLVGESSSLGKFADYLILKRTDLQRIVSQNRNVLEAKMKSIKNIEDYKPQTDMGIDYDRRVYASQNTAENIERLQDELGGVYQDIQVQDKQGVDRTIETMLFGVDDQPFDFEKKTVLLFTGSGNRAENYAYPMVKRLQTMGAQVMIVNPMGFGGSEGEVSGSNLLHSADAAYAFLTDPEKEEHMDEKNVAVMGFSLGGAMAAHLSAQHPDSRFIGDRTFTSIAEVGVSELEDQIKGMGVKKNILGKERTLIKTDTMLHRGIAKFAGAMTRPLLKNIVGDLEVKRRLQQAEGKRFIASGTREDSGKELARKMAPDEKTTIVEFEGDHLHHDNYLWFDIRDEDAPFAFADFMSEFINE